MAVYLHVDMSDAQGLIERVQDSLTQEEFAQIMFRSFRKTGSQVKGILKEELPDDYMVTKSVVGKAVGKHNTAIKGRNVTCCIPITGKMRHIGGSVEAIGGIRGWLSAGLGGKKYKVYARILQKGVSELPEEMEKHADNAPFRNLGAKKIGDVAYVRNSTGKASFVKPGKNKFVSITAVSVPQMPMNLSRDDVQDEIVDSLKLYIEEEYTKLINKCR